MTEPWLEGPDEPPVIKPHRDRVTRIAYTQLALFAWLMYAFGATNALLRDDQGTSRTLSGLHSTSLAVSGILAGLIASSIVSRWGRGRVLRLASAGLVLGIVVYTWPATSYPLSMTGAFLCGFFGTLVVIAINAFLLDHQGAAGPATLTEANALASVSGLLGPLAVGIGAATIFGWRMGLVVVAFGFVLVEIWRGRDVAAFGAAGAERHEEHRALPLPRRVYWSFALIMCFLGTEMSAVYWSADLLRERAGFGAAAAAAALAAVTGGMAVGRYAGSRLARSIPGERLLRLSVVIALIGFALMWVPTFGGIIILGMFVTGMGLGVQWPLGVSRAVHESGGMTDRAAALCSVFGSIAIAIAPFALGALADSIGFHAAFLLMPMLLVTAMVILLVRPARTTVAAAQQRR